MVLKSILNKLQQGLSKTKAAFTQKFRNLFSVFRTIDEPFLNQLEETLISSDMGVQTSGRVIEEVKKAFKERRIETTDQILDFLKTHLKQILRRGNPALNLAPTPPTVILVAGVNGSGKTTSIAKLTHLLRQEGKNVLLAAADTFRAAAIEQLTIWSQRQGVDIIKHQTGADPGAVVYDAVEAALSRRTDVLIIDTAGRLQTKQNLMKELGKIRNVITKKIPAAPQETLLVLDATTGQNAISQARHFNEAIQVTGLFLSKLDGTAKGGIVIAIQEELGIPVKFIGVGEQSEDIEVFNSDTFIDTLFE